MSLTDNFDKLNKNKNGEPEKPEAGKEIEHYETTGSTRNLCFVQPNGKKLFLNYSYLISGEYSPEESSIVLTYTTHVVTLKGHKLESLFESMMAHVPKQITCVEKRYEGMKEEKEIIVKEIVIQKN